MKLLLNILLIGGLSYLSGIFGWWVWDFAVIAFLVAYFTNANGWSSFIAGFLAIGVLWLVVAMMLNIPNEGMLANKVAQMFKLPNASAILIVTALVGALVGGFGALTGSLFRAALVPPKSRRLKHGRTMMRRW